MSKAKRKGKIFIDWLRNQRGSTAIMPYSARARKGAPVATPTGWDALADIDSPGHWTIADAKTDAMNACDDRDREQFERAQKLDRRRMARGARDREQFERAQKLDRRRMARGVACGLFGALLPLGPRIEEVEVGARGKVAKTAAQHDCPAARLLRRGEFGKQHAHQLWSDEIIGTILHGRHGQRNAEDRRVGEGWVR